MQDRYKYHTKRKHLPLQGNHTILTWFRYTKINESLKWLKNVCFFFFLKHVLRKDLSFVQTKRKRTLEWNFSSMSPVYSLIIFAFVLTFAWCEQTLKCVLFSEIKLKLYRGFHVDFYGLSSRVYCIPFSYMPEKAFS